MKVEQIEPKSNSLEDLQEYIALLSSVVRDKQPRSSEKLFNRLLTESIGDKASRVLEYIPCTIIMISDRSVINLMNDSSDIAPQLFGFFTNEGYHTNARELLNMGWSLEVVLGTVDFTHYKVFLCEAPYFIYGQVSTHNQLTTVSHSQRYAECDRGYWKPPEVGYRQKAWDRAMLNWRPNDLRDTMKAYGVKRKEVFDRGADMLQNRVFTIGGYTNNPNAWQHFFKQRLDKHTQLETREFVSMLFDHKNN